MSVAVPFSSLLNEGIAMSLVNKSVAFVFSSLIIFQLVNDTGTRYYAVINVPSVIAPVFNSKSAASPIKTSFTPALIAP